MKKLILIFASIVVLASCATTKKPYRMANGKRITEQEFKAITHKAFEDSFGKMSESEDSLLFGGVKVTIDTINVVPDTLSGN